MGGKTKGSRLRRRILQSAGVGLALSSFAVSAAGALGTPDNDFIVVEASLSGGGVGSDVLLVGVNPADAQPGLGVRATYTGDSSGQNPDNASYADLFLFGDDQKPYFVGRGDRDYGRITDFSIEQGDRVLLHGSPADYTVADMDARRRAGAGIYRRVSGGTDLVAVIETLTAAQVRLDGPQFRYATTPSATPAVSGGFQLGGDSAEAALRVTADSSGNIYLAGITYGSLPGATTTGRLFISKHSATGARQWVRQIGDDVRTSPFGLLVSGSTLYLAGPTNGSLGGTNAGKDDAIIMTFDTVSGTTLAMRQFGTPGLDTITDLTTDGAGSLYASGITSGELGDNTPRGTAQDTADDSWVGKFRMSDLSRVWIQQFGPAGTPDDWNEAWGGVAFAPDGSGIPGRGSVLASGWTQSAMCGGCTQNGYSDAWAVSYSDSGTQRWVRQWGSPSYEWPWASDLDSQGNYYVASLTFANNDTFGGTAKGLADTMVTKFSPDGTLLWTRQIGTDQDDVARSLDIVDDVVYLGGHTRGSFGGANRGEEDSFVAKLTTSGSLSLVKQYGTADNENTRSFVANGRVYVAGGTFASFAGPHVHSADAFAFSVSTATLT